MYSSSSHTTETATGLGKVIGAVRRVPVTAKRPATEHSTSSTGAAGRVLTKSEPQKIVPTQTTSRSERTTSTVTSSESHSQDHAIRTTQKLSDKTLTKQDKPTTAPTAAPTKETTAKEVVRKETLTTSAKEALVKPAEKPASNKEPSEKADTDEILQQSILECERLREVIRQNQTDLDRLREFAEAEKSSYESHLEEMNTKIQVLESEKMKLLEENKVPSKPRRLKSWNASQEKENFQNMAHDLVSVNNSTVSTVELLARATRHVMVMDC